MLATELTNETKFSSTLLKFKSIIDSLLPGGLTGEFLQAKY
jgi:hypothetical protein